MCSQTTVIKEGAHGKQNLNPDLIVRLKGEVNEATVLIDGVQTTALVDSGAQMPAMTDSFAQQLELPEQKLGKILNLEATGRGSVPFSGYVEAE